MLSLKTWTAAAISPISSLRSASGTAAAVSPSASRFMAAVMRRTGRDMPRPTAQANRTPTSSAAPAVINTVTRMFSAAEIIVAMVPCCVCVARSPIVAASLSRSVPTSTAASNAVAMLVVPASASLNALVNGGRSSSIALNEAVSAPAWSSFASAARSRP